MSESKDLVQLMREKASAVAATVVEVANIQEAYAYALDICEKKEPCLIMPTGGDAETHSATDRIIAAPNLSEAEYETFSALCAERGIICMQSGLRKLLGGFDIGLTHVDLGIAETGTCVLNSNSESVRIASMVCEYHLAILPKSKIVETSYEAEDILATLMQQGTPHFTAFISGPSRTADIERVLALGVHGPLELHLIIVEG
ncbi:MAG: lactate utilization protein [Pseudomonadota bacterium]